MENVKTSLILHGHFYQPPRENPATGIIEIQPSADPFINWNEKICSQCYGANAFSRYLNEKGQIVSLTNNYSYISFNFGPTLLSWLKEYHPIYHEMIVQADRDSIKRLGHGNALSQCFNHTILPLDKVDDAKLQIAWGIEDFIYRFDRAPEGMWLAECGINGDVIDLLSEAGIKFVILSPWQCYSVENPNTGKQEVLNGISAPYDRPYILTGNKGRKITAFFYHPELAQMISFEHALRSADSLYDKLLEIKNRDKVSLLHTATDGEIYGHHEPFGDMALAALIKKVNDRDDFVFTNYATILEETPATLHAILHKGEESKGTSWSCSHGVSRWYKDCGCHTGGEYGWNQKWRTPFRDGLNMLSSKLDDIFKFEIDKIFSSKLSSEELLLRAADVFISKSSMGDFIKALHKEYTFDEKYDFDIARLLLGILNKHFSFTSCGFFFSDISGIEPRQNIKYALYAIKMMQKYSSEDLLFPFLSEIRKAKSNIKSEADAMIIAQNELKVLSGEVEAAVYFYINRVLATKESYSSSYGNFELTDFSSTSSDNARVSLYDKNSLIKYEYSILSSSSITQGLNLYICENSPQFECYKLTGDDLSLYLLQYANDLIEENLNLVKIDNLKDVVNNIYHFSVLLKSSKVLPIKALTLENLANAIGVLKNIFSLSSNNLSWEEKKAYISLLLEFVQKYGTSNLQKEIAKIITKSSTDIAYNLRSNPLDDEMCDNIIELYEISRLYGFEPDSKNLQNEVYEYYIKNKLSSIDSEKLRQIYTILNFQ